MKRIAIVMNEDHRLIFSGVTRFVMEIAPRLSEDFQVKIISTRSERGIRHERINPSLEIIQFPLCRVPVPNVPIPKFSRELTDHLQEADLVFIQTLDLIGPLYRTLRLKKPLVLYRHLIESEMVLRMLGWEKAAFLLGPLIRLYCRFWYDRAAHVGLPSPDFAAPSERMKIGGRYSCIPLGIDPGRFFPPADKAEAKRRLGLDPGGRMIGFVGRLWPEKNIDLLLRIVSRLHGEDPRVRLLLVGQGFARYERAALAHPAVVWVGQQSDTAPYFQAMDVYCHPLLPNETWSLATMEAMSAGLPVVVNAIGCPREYVRHGLSGFLVDPPNREDLFLRYLRDLLADPARRADVGQRAREGISREFSWDRTTESLRRVFNQCIQAG